MRRSLADARHDSDISLRDLVVALARLRPGDVPTRAAIMRLVGFAPPREIQPAAATQPPPADPRSDRLKPEGAGRVTSVSGGARPARPRPRLEPVGVDAPAGGATIATPSLAAEGSPRGPGAAERIAEPELAPLLEPRWTRDVLVHALATAMPIGPVHVPALVRLLARGRPVVEIPRTPVMTLLRGAQVLVDIGESMEPFAADQDQLVETIRRVGGHQHVRVLSFRGSPARAGEGPTWTWARYQPPPEGTPVIVISDFGAGPAAGPDHASAEEWLALLDSLPRSTPVIAFSPYPERRVAAAILRRITYLQWDRRLTPRAVVVRRRRGRQ